MYRIKMLCYDKQNHAPYEDVSSESYNSKQEAKTLLSKLQCKKFQS